MTRIAPEESGMGGKNALKRKGTNKTILALSNLRRDFGEA